MFQLGHYGIIEQKKSRVSHAPDRNQDGGQGGQGPGGNGNNGRDGIKK